MGKITAWLKGSSFGSKVRNIYIVAGVVVLILALVAFRMTNQSDIDAAAEGSDDGGVEDNGSTVDGEPTANNGWYSSSPLNSGGGFGGGGQVTYPGIDAGTDIPEPAGNPEQDNIETNSEWYVKGVAYLVANGYSSTKAATALSTYLQSGQLSQEQGKLRDAVISEFGYPPDRPSDYIAPKIVAAPGTTNNVPAPVKVTPQGTALDDKGLVVANPIVANPTLNAPATPTVVKVTATSVRLSTNAVAGATGYLWYLNGKLFDSTAGSTTTIEGLVKSTKYTASVSAQGKSGEGPLSSGRAFTTPSK